MSNSTEQKIVKIIADGKQAEASINQITRAVSALNRERNKQKVGSDGYKEMSKDLAGLNARLTTARNEVKNLDSASKKFWSNAKTIGAGVVGGNFITAAISGIGQVFSSTFDHMKKLSDEYANIRKVTGLSQDQVKDLDSTLKNLNTKTGRSELRSWAVEAGKLGEEGVNNIAKFVKEADMIGVALGEDLGEGAVTTIARLSKIFKVSMLEIGSALNEIGASSAATEAYQVDFLNRMAGTGPTVKLAADELLGYSATLENMGQSAEVSGTALSKFFIEFIKDVEKFGQIAGMQKGKLTDLLNSQGTNAAFMAFLENLKKNKNGAQQMAGALDEMQIDGARSVGVFLSLANSIDDVAQNQAIANTAIKEGTSLTNEFNIKNETFAAKWEKVKKVLSSIFMEGPIGSGVKKMIDLFVRLGTSFANTFGDIKTDAQLLTDELVKMGDLQRQMNDDFEILKRGNLSLDARKELIKQINQNYKEYLPNLISEKSSLEELTAAQESANKAFDRSIFLKITQSKLEEQQKKLIDAQISLKNKELALARLNEKITVNDDIKATTGVSGKAYQKNLLNLQTDEQLKKDIESAKKQVEDLGQIMDELAKDKFKKSVTELLDEKINSGGVGKVGGVSAVKSSKTTKINQDLIDDAKQDVDIQIRRNNPDAPTVDPVDEEFKQRIETERKNDKKLDDIENQRQREKLNRAADYAQDVSNIYFEIQRQRQQAELNREIKHLEAMRYAELDNKNLTEAQKEKINAEYDAKRKALLEDNWEKEQRAKIAQIGMDTAVAAVKAFTVDPTGILSGIVIANGLLQASNVANTPMPQFAMGGLTGVVGASDGRKYQAQNIGSFKNGGSINKPSFGLIGEQGSELVVPNWLYQAPRMANTMQALEGMINNTRPFASGGNTSEPIGFSPKDDKEMKQLLKMNAAMLNILNLSLKNGIVAETIYDRVAEEKYKNRNEKAKVLSEL